MIADFRCKDTKALFDGGNPRHFSSFASVALRKLDMLDAAKCAAHRVEIVDYH